MTRQNEYPSIDHLPSPREVVLGFLGVFGLIIVPVLSIVKGGIDLAIHNLGTKRHPVTSCFLALPIAINTLFPG